MPGPAPKPTKLKILAGNPGRRPLNDREPAPAVPDRLPYAPRFLSPEAKREWKRLGKYLLEAGLFSELDFAALTLYCSAWGKWIEAERELAASGGPVLVHPESGGLYRNPWIDMANKAQAQIRQMLSEFGLSPAQRSRVVALGAGAQAQGLEAVLGKAQARAAGGRR